MELSIGPNQKYGYQVEGQDMRYAGFLKTVADAKLAVSRGQRIVALDAPGLTPAVKRANLAKLKGAIEASE